MPDPIWNFSSQTSFHAWSAIPEELRALIGAEDDRDEITASLSHFKAAGLDVAKPHIFALAVEGARNNAQRRPVELYQAHPSKPRSPEASESPVVYYVRVGHLVKIGTSISLTARMRAYPPGSTLLATEPGGYDVERERLQQFSGALAESREWFHPSAALIQHINSLREQPLTAAELAA